MPQPPGLLEIVRNRIRTEKLIPSKDHIHISIQCNTPETKVGAI